MYIYIHIRMYTQVWTQWFARLVFQEDDWLSWVAKSLPGSGGQVSVVMFPATWKSKNTQNHPCWKIHSVHLLCKACSETIQVRLQYKNKQPCTILVFTFLWDQLSLVERFTLTPRLDRMRVTCVVWLLKWYCITCCIVHIILTHTLVVGVHSYKLQCMVDIKFQGTTKRSCSCVLLFGTSGSLQISTRIRRKQEHRIAWLCFLWTCLGEFVSRSLQCQDTVIPFHYPSTR